MIGVVVALVLAVCWPTCLALHARWTDSEAMTYTHGYLIAAVSAYLIWRANSGPMPEPARRSTLALVLLLLAGLAWVLGVRSGLVFMEWMLLPLLLLLALWAAFGKAVMKRSAFGIAYLYFAMPLWGAFNGVLQWVTVMVVRGLLRLAGIPSHFEGNVVHIPSGTFEIAGGCSGLHFLMVGLAIGALMGEMRADGWRGRLTLLAIAGALSVLTNWVRVFTIIVAGHYTDMQHYLVSRSHYGYGWLLFSVAMVVFFVLERRVPTGTTKADMVPAPSATMGQPASVAVVAVTMALVASLQWLSSRPARTDISGPQEPVGWTPRPEGGAAWQPVVPGADIVRRETYASDRVELLDRQEYVFLRHRQGKELGGESHDPLGGGEMLHGTKVRMGPVDATLYQVEDVNAGQWLIAASYGVMGRYYATPVPAQLRYAAESLIRLSSQPARVLLWRIPCVPDCENAQQRLFRFIHETESEG